MSSTGSHSDGPDDGDWDAFLCDGAGDEDELALRIALEPSQVDTSDNSGSGATRPVARSHNANADADPSRPTRGSTRQLNQRRPFRLPPPPLAAAPRGQRWVLVLALLSSRMRTVEREARAARRERQRARKMGGTSYTAARTSGRQRVMPAVPGEDERLLQWVYR